MSSEQYGQRVGDYEILGVLGAGGMGKVYKVRNVISDRIEAMKILLPDLAGQKELADRFLREIKLLASLNHPNIASLRTALTSGNQLVMIMEFVEGTTLAARLAQGPVPAADAVDYVEQVLSALNYAHHQHIIHRDIKPANMMLTPQGLVKLMDFGIARSSQDTGLTMTGTTLGSLYYMSPEQIRGEGADERSDLYSLGVSLYELVTGRRPFQAENNYALMAGHLQEAPKPPIEWQPDLPGPLNQIILMAMAKDPAQRFQSAEAFDNALRSTAASLPKRTAGEAAAAFQKRAPGATAAEPPSPVVAGSISPPVSPRAEPIVSTSARTASVAPAPQLQALPAPAPRTYRGLYMTLGALLVVAVLAVAALYVPKWAKTRASGSATPAPQPSNPPPSNPPAIPSAASSSGGSSPQAGPESVTATSPDSAKATPDGGAAPAASTSTTPVSRPAQNGPSAGGVGRQATAPGVLSEGSAAGAGEGAAAASAGGSAQAAPPNGNAAVPPADPATLDDLEHRMDQLSSRAGAAKGSIDKLGSEIAAQGGNLRGDISASEQRMETYLNRAQTAFQNQDAKKTKQYLDEAETEVETLEKFLNQR
jgi:serine/threonine protein kinase